MANIDAAVRPRVQAKPVNAEAGVRRVRRRRPGWGFVAPYVILLLIFGVAPVVYAFYEAFVVTPIVGPTTFSLTQNFVDVLTDYRLPGSIGHVAGYLLLWLPTMLVVVFTIALAMDAKRTKFAALTRFVAYVPGAITGGAAALLWLFMFTPRVSPIGSLLNLFADRNGEFVSNSTMPVVLAVMGIAAGAGGWIILLFGALTAIDSEVLEAARIDGANAWQSVWRIKLPMIRRYIAFILIISSAQGFQVFVEPTVLSAGAPRQISPTWSINQLVYSYAATNANYGRASALSIVLLVICVALAVVVIKKTKFYSIGDR